jgi:putative ABC transport system permease protein
MIARSWSTAFRLSWRTARRTPGRALLIAALIGLPVFGAVGLDLVLRTAAPAPEAYARWHFGTADAHLEVTPLERASLDELSRNGVVLSPTQTPESADPERDPAAVDVAKLLPAGTGIYPAAANRPMYVPLAARDRLVRADVDLIDTRNAMSQGMTLLRSGRLPEAADEVAVAPGVASRLRLTTPDGELRRNAMLRLPNQRTVRVVGLAEPPDCLGCDTAVALPGGLLAGVGQENTARLVTFTQSSAYFLTLPDLSRQDLSALVEQLASKGVGLLPRDAVVHPDDWKGVGIEVAPPADRTYLTERAGAFTLAVVMIGFGLLEVVLLAGTAFAVGVRRQVTEFGLLAATGAAPRDLRRIVLAQGVLLGAVGAAGGIGLGLALPPLARPILEPIFRTELATWAFEPLDYLLLAALGALSGLVAAVVPAFGAGRLDPVRALSGRFNVPVRRARVARTALGLLSAGVLAGAVGTAWLDRQFRAFEHDLSALNPAGPLALVLGGLVLVTAGLVWLMPAALTLVAAAGRALPATARLGFRDASRPTNEPPTCPPHRPASRSSSRRPPPKTPAKTSAGTPWWPPPRLLDRSWARGRPCGWTRCSRLPARYPTRWSPATR